MIDFPQVTKKYLQRQIPDVIDHKARRRPRDRRVWRSRGTRNTGDARAPHAVCGGGAPSGTRPLVPQSERVPVRWKER